MHELRPVVGRDLHFLNLTIPLAALTWLPETSIAELREAGSAAARTEQARAAASPAFGIDGRMPPIRPSAG
jgi:hypothetical protein